MIKNNIIYLFVLVNFIIINNLSASANSIIAVINDDLIVQSQLNHYIEEYMFANKTSVRPSKKQIIAILDREIYAILQTQYAKSKRIEIKPQALNKKLILFAKQNNISLQNLKELPNYQIIVNRIILGSIIPALKEIISRDKITVSEQEVEQVYEKQKDNNYQYHLYNIVLDDFELINELQDRLNKQPNLFQNLAKQYSKAYNAKNNGDMGYLKYQKIPKLYKEYIKELKKGDISKLISNDGNYHLLKLADIKTKESATNQVKIKHILLLKNTNNSPILNQIHNRALEKALYLHKELINGADFATIAKENSRDDYAKEGGVLPWLNIESLPQEAQKELAKLVNNELSVPFETKFGWHIIQKIATRVVILAKLKIKQQILSEKRNKIYAKWLTELKENSTVKVYDYKIK